ncbi:HNH endonuclease signature motif containing protein [Terriglobus roseus]
MCLDEQRVTPATEVHHIIPIRTDPTKRLDRSNLMSLCKPCHSRITATSLDKALSSLQR